MTPKEFLAGFAVEVVRTPLDRYVLSGAGAVLDKSAGVEVVVYGADHLPAVGLWVVNLFPDGHGDDPQQTTAAGRVQFDFGPASAYTPPARGPYRILLAGSARKNDERYIELGEKLSEIVDGIGDVGGRHTFWSLQFVERLPAPVVEPAPELFEPIDSSLRTLAWSMRGASWNPDAALYKIAGARALGYPLSGEFPFRVGVVPFVAQLFNGGILYCVLGDWEHVRLVSWL